MLPPKKGIRFLRAEGAFARVPVFATGFVFTRKGIGGPLGTHREFQSVRKGPVAPKKNVREKNPGRS